MSFECYDGIRISDIWYMTDIETGFDSYNQLFFDKLYVHQSHFQLFCDTLYWMEVEVNYFFHV